MLLLFKNSNWIWSRRRRWNNEQTLPTVHWAHLSVMYKTSLMYSKLVFPCTPSIRTNQKALRSLAWKCNLTFIPSENALVDSGCYPVIQGGRLWEPKLQSIYPACVLKAIKSLRYAANVWTHLSEAYTSLSTLLAVAAKMKYWPLESHLAPNWAIVLLFSPFRLWLSLL